jgi:glycosyltransferase involved in cell wall biosynthesis
MKSVSVIMPTCNKARYLDLTLASFESQQYASYELVVVDDGSSDDTPDVIARYHGRLNIKHRRQENRGRSGARNTAIKLAEGDVIIFSDDDRIVAPDFVAAHAEHFDASDAVQVLGWQRGIASVWRADLSLPPRTLWELLSRRTVGNAAQQAGPIDLIKPDDLRQAFDTTIESFVLPERWWEEGCRPAVEHYGEDLEGFAIPWVLGTTGNLAASRRLILEIGLLDENYRGWGLEDLDLCYRLHHAGARSVVSRRAVNYHQAHPTATGKRAQWLENLLYFMRKYDRLDAAFYGHNFTRPAVVDLKQLNQRWVELSADHVGEPLWRDLRRAYIELVQIRIRTLEWSGGSRLLGMVQEEW